MTEPPLDQAPDQGVDAALTRNPKLSLPARRLAGSTACLNCGTRLQGPFCHYCGQPDRNFLRFFPVLLRELMSDLLDLDSRFTRTLKALLLHPGRLTRDYLEGKRFRYTPPLRLYLFASIAFFILAAFFSQNAIQIETNGPGSGDATISVSPGSEAERREIEEALESLPPSVRERVQLDPETLAIEKPPEDFVIEPDFQFNDQPWDRETNPLVIPFMPDRLNDWINDEIENSPNKAKQINENPRLIVDKVFDVLPGTMFVMLPAVALIFKFWYLFARRYYLEHLVLALHNHAFVFVCLIGTLLLEALEQWCAARGLKFGEQAAYWASYVIAVWIPVYLLLALKTVYRQSWWLTIAKALAIALSYLALLVFVATAVALLSFLLL